MTQLFSSRYSHFLSRYNYFHHDTVIFHHDTIISITIQSSIFMIQSFTIAIRSSIIMIESFLSSCEIIYSIFLEKIIVVSINTSPLRSSRSTLHDNQPVNHAKALPWQQHTRTPTLPRVLTPQNSPAFCKEHL